MKYGALIIYKRNAKCKHWLLPKCKKNVILQHTQHFLDEPIEEAKPLCLKLNLTGKYKRQYYRVRGNAQLRLRGMHGIYQPIKKPTK